MKVFYYLLREEGVIIARNVVLEYVLKKCSTYFALPIVVVHCGKYEENC